MSSSPAQPPTQKLSGANRANSAMRSIFGNETLAYIVKRVLQALLTLLLASFLSFMVVQLAPGDFLTPFRSNPEFSRELLAQYVKDYGLDKSFLEQYFRWLQQAVRGNFGISFAYLRPATEILWERVPNTLLLSAASIVVTWAIAIPFGIIGAVNQDRWLDKFLRILSYIGQGFPTIITGLLLLFFAQLTTPLFPVGGRTSLYHDELNWVGQLLDVVWHLILPTLALSITSFAGLQRIMRGQMLDVLRQDYIQTARAKGLSENKVVYVHALRNAINPLITILGFEFSSLLSGSFIIENYFSWPGLGTLTLEAIQKQDLFLVMASLVLGAVMLIVGNLLADLLLSFVDPRIKLSRMN
ncbi:MAG: ABC transporter substrate-binding protein [Leptolyngbya foveolarum]|uniref:ABC transporter substrate-binding protein n=1 Tax=Leptolyngbya foveolarum TaxID=47253 RepID=A0A2W4U186_9CYAN|nr:MAG: ABC transporter substrate-binding protein [Leptolyngbya foveolarum]